MKLHRNSTFTLSSTAARRRILSLAGLAGAAMAVGLLGGQLQADTAATWTGANASNNDYWLSSNNWAGSVVPNNGGGIIYDVTIPNPANALNSDLSGISPVIGQLTTQVGTTLYNSNGTGAGNETLTIDPSTMTVQAGSNIAGTVSDSSSALQTLNFGNGHASAVTSTISGVVSGNVALIVDQPTGTVVLSGANTYTGGTTIDGGTLSISADNNLGGSAGGITFGGGTLQTTVSIIDSRAITLNAGGGTIDGDGNSDLFSGLISGTGGLTVINSSGTTGAIIQLAANAETYQGATNIGLNAEIALGSGASIANSSGVNFTGNGELSIFAGTTINGLTGMTGAVGLSSQALTINVASGTDSFGGTLVDGGFFGGTGGSLIKTGTGTLTLSGANTYTGATTISAGTLAISGSGSIADSGYVNVAGGATFDISGLAGTGTTIHNLEGIGNVTLGSETLTINSNVSTVYYFGGDIAGTGGVTVAGTYLTFGPVFNGTNTYTGATTVSTGTLGLYGTGSIADSSGVAVASGAYFDISGASTGVAIQDLSGGGTASLGGNNLTVSVASGDSTFSGIIENTGGAYSYTTPGGLIKTGAGTLTLSGANTYTGGTTINGGTLSISADNNLGGSAGGITFGGGTLQTTTGITDSRAITLNAGGGTIDTAGTSDTFSGAFTGSGGLTVTSSISGGTLTLSGANTYSGGTNLNAGTVSVSAGSNLGTGILTFNGGTLLTTAASTFSQGITVNAGGAFINTDGFTDTFNGFVNGSGTLTVTGGGTAVLNNSNGFGLGYAIEGNSTINLSGFGPGGNNNSVTFSGNTTQGLLTYGFGGPGDQLNNVTISDTNATTTNIIDAGNGTLPIDGQLSNSDPNATLVLRNGFFYFSGLNSGFAAGTLEITGSAILEVYSSADALGTGAILALNSGAVIDNTTGLTFTNAVVVDAGGGTLDTNNQFWKISGGISGSGNLTVESSNAGGTLILSGADTASGSITINSGTTLEFSGNTAGFTGNIADNSKLIFAQTAASSLSGIISGSGTLTQNGTAALTLSGANTYTGGTTLDAGTVSVSSGSNLGTGPLTFNGGTLLATAATTLSQNIDVNSGGGTIDGGGQILTLAGALADSSGTLTLQNGTIVLGSTSNATDFAGGTLQIGAGTGVGAGVVQFAASANLPGGGAGITLNNGELDYTGSVAASVSSKITPVGTTGNIVNVGNGPLTLSGAFSGTGNVTLTGTAGNTITLTGDSGANNGDYSGGVTITGGITVVFANNNDLDTGNFGFGSVTLATAGDTLQYGANNIELGNSMAVNAASAIDVNGTTGSRMIGTITGSGALTIMNSSATASRLTLAENAANTYSGAITIGANATLALSGSASIADSSGVTLDIGGGANSVLDISGLTNGGASLASLASAGVGAGPGTASVVLGANTLTITNASGNFAGVISGTGGLTLSAGTETRNRSRPLGLSSS